MDAIAFLQQAASPSLDTLAVAITNLGSMQVYLAVLIAVYLGVSPSFGQRLGIYFLLSIFLNLQLKQWFASPRPYSLEPALLRLPHVASSDASYAFPSGHAQGTATLWGLLALYVRRLWLWLVVLLLLLLVGLSRIYLGVHIPLDILGGWGIALLFIVLVWWLEGFLSDLELRNSWLAVTLGILTPLALHLWLDFPESEVISAGLAAFISGPLLIEHRSDVDPVQRLIVVAMGLLLVFAALLGSSMFLPEVIKRHPLGGFGRYLLIGYSGLVLTPWLSRNFGWTPPKRFL